MCAGSAERSVASGMADLHPRRQLVAPDAGGQRVGLGLLLQVDRVELLEQLQARALGLGRGAAGGLEVADRRAAARVEGHALMLGGQEPARPVEGPAGGVGDAAGVGQDDEAGKVLVLGPEAVREPRAHRREAHLAEPGVRLEDAGDVVGGLGDHRVDHRQLVGDLGQAREQVGDPEAALARVV